jgi:hypothetical protein
VIRLVEYSIQRDHAHLVVEAASTFDLRAPREVRNALSYVLLNARKHAVALRRRRSARLEHRSRVLGSMVHGLAGRCPASDRVTGGCGASHVAAPARLAETRVDLARRGAGTGWCSRCNRRSGGGGPSSRDGYRQA